MSKTSKRSLDWMREVPRRIMAGMHILDADQLGERYRTLHSAGELPGILELLDVPALIEMLKAARVQAFWFYCKGGGGNAFYPSRAGHVLSTLNGRDLFGELCEACLSAGIQPYGIYECSDTRVKSEHPEWNLRCPLTQRGEPGGLPPGGPSAPGSGYGEMVIEQTREVLRDYPIKAYYLDAVGGGTRNGALLGPDQYERFRKTFGFEFTGLHELTPVQKAAYIRWLIDETGTFVEKARRVAAELRPEVAFTYNYAGRPDVCDFVTSDLFVFGTGALGVLTGLRRNAALSRAAMGEVLLDTVGQEWNAGVKGTDSYLAETWSARSLNVAVCSSFVLPLDGRVPPEQVELAGRALREQAACEEWFAGMEPVFEIGILNAHDARKFRPVDPALPELHQREYEGWAQAAVAGHFLWDFLDEWLLSPERLARLPVVVLPAAGCLSADAVEVLRDYVRNGGTLIATGDTSCYSASGEPHGDFQLAEVFGARLSGKRDAGAVFLDRGPEGEPLYMKYGQWPVEALDEARVAGTVRRFARLRPKEGPRPLHGMTLGSREPGWVEQKYGRGRCCYLAGLPGLDYALRGRHACKRFMIARLQAALDGRRLLTVDAPDTVEAFAHWQASPRRLVVNLVNQVTGCSRSMNGSRIEDVDRVPPVAEAGLHFDEQHTGALETIYLAPERIPLPLERTKDGVIAKVPSFPVHATVVAECRR